MNAIDVLKRDHRNVEKLFSDFLAADDDVMQEDLFQQIQTELSAHAEAEEKVFYPALESESPDKVEHAIEEHQKVKQLLAELLDMDFADEEFDSKFTELMTSVQDHVQEEEGPDGVMEMAESKYDDARLSDMARQIEEVKRDSRHDLAA
jgi:hemerythrin superfamily protein